MSRAVTLAVRDLHKTFRLLREPSTTILQATLHALTRRREDLPVLRGLTFEAYAGEALAIIGANGVGKSTLLKLLAGILFPEAGEIVRPGKVSALLELGAGFQPELTGRDNLYLNATILGLTRNEIREREAAIVAFAGLENFMDVPVKYYSTGMYMRLGFAVAVHVNAAVILIDEVFAVGDEVFQFKCLEKLLELKRGGTTLLLVSHDLNLVGKVADRVLWLNNGVVEREGPPAEIIAMYRAGKGGSEVAAARWGSREIEFTGVELRAPDGAPTTEGPVSQREQEVPWLRPPTARVAAGAGLTVVMRYRTRDRIEKPVFGFSIHNRAGVLLVGDNTLNRGIVIPEVSGEGTITLTLPNLPFPPGNYLLSVAAHDISGAKPYDFREKEFPFELASADFHTGAGLVALPQDWRLGP